MQKIKPLYRHIILAASYLFLTAIFFAGGYSLGFHSSAKPSEPVTAAFTHSASPSYTPETEPQRYRVILEDGELRLYSDENGISRLISTEVISEESFPPRDMAILKEGVSFDVMEDALSLMENFLS